MLSVIIILTKLNLCHASHCPPRMGQWDAYIKSMYRPLYIMGGWPDGVGEVLITRWSNGRAVEWAVTYVKRRKGWRMSCDVGEATKGSLQHELSRIGTLFFSNKLFSLSKQITVYSIWFFHGAMRRNGGQSGTLCISLHHTVAMLIFLCPDQSIQENTRLLNIEIYRNACLTQWFHYTNCKLKWKEFILK